MSDLNHASPPFFGNTNATLKPARSRWWSTGCLGKACYCWKAFVVVTSNSCMKTVLLILSVLLPLVRLTSAQSVDASHADVKSLPTMDFLLQQVVNRAVGQEGRNDNLFDMNYQYDRIRTWEYRNNRWRVRSAAIRTCTATRSGRSSAPGNRHRSP